ncbi:unnamed protein product [Ceutorhynchus assimilis]|uniref:SET domain-containing protein n=1 Tax=Ceutorhynchus assimilis TaxID=467358 RepID=A0A9P0DHD3_9CUCU|nr:unnamed protein product [Ceutorhynchus assimilis]
MGHHQAPLPDFDRLLSIPKEIFGLKKFYTDEFDAFKKYYSKINQCMDDNSIRYLANEANELPYLLPCELSSKVKKDSKNEGQNFEVAPMKQTNDKIEFANSCLNLVESHNRGKCLVTTSQVNQGDILIDETATVLQVNPICNCVDGEHKMFRCHHCAFAVNKYLACSHCNVVIYCTPRCLIQSYNDYHKYECEGFQRHYWRLDDSDHSYIALRMILYGARYNFNHDIPANHDKWGINGNNYPFVYRLKTNFDKMPILRVYEILRKAAHTIIYLMVRTNFFSELQPQNETILHYYVGGLFVKHYCQAQMNCVQLRYPNFEADYSFNTVGTSGKAICPTLAMLNHSCSPNAVVVLCNDRVLVKAIRKIEANEEVTIAYKEINPFNSLQERQLLMLHYFYFETVCDCELCFYESTWQEYPFKCRSCALGRAKKMTLNNGEEKLYCKNCTSFSFIDHKAEKSALIAGKLYKSTYNIEPILRVLDSCTKIFPCDSWVLMDLYKLLFDKFYTWGEKPIETMKYGLCYYKVLEKYMPKLYPAVLEAKLCFIYGTLNTREFKALEKVTKTEFATVQRFSDECLRAKKDILFYVPHKVMGPYATELVSHLQNVQVKLRTMKER